MRTTWKKIRNKTKLTFLLALTFLCSIFILTSCATSPPNYETAYFKNGKKVECHKKNCQLNKDKFYCEVFAETGTPPPNFTRSTSDTSSKVTTHSGYMTDQFGGSTYSYSGTSRTQTDQMQQGLQSFGNALGNLARMKQYEERLENRFRKCMNITMGYDLRRIPVDDICSGPIKECEKLNSLNHYDKKCRKVRVYCQYHRKENVSTTNRKSTRDGKKLETNQEVNGTDE